MLLRVLGLVFAGFYWVLYCGWVFAGFFLVFLPFLFLCPFVCSGVPTLFIKFL
jgi:hypothetical protein